jgi:tetratricopeptide (TPR) repeat protein
MNLVRTPSMLPLLAPLFLGLAAGACGKDGPASGAAPKVANQPAAAPGTLKGDAADPKGAPKAGAKAKGGAATLAYKAGLQALMKGEPEKALGEFERATQLDAAMSEAFYELGKLQVHVSSQNVGSQARDLTVLDKGLAALAQAKKLEPSNDQYWFWFGRATFLKNDVAGAEAALKKAVELNPKHAQAWKTLGRVQKSNGETAVARDSFQKAIENEPSDAGAYFQLGQTLEELNDLPNARAAYEKSLGLDGTEPEVFGRLLQVCAKLGDADCEAKARAGMEGWTEYDKRLQRARRDVNQKPNDAKALRRLGLMHFEVGKWEEALEWFLKSIHIDPKDAKTHLFCGMARLHLKDYANAENHLKEAEFLAPDNLDPKLELLALYGASENRAGFDELLSKVEGEAAEDGASLYALGETCAAAERAEDAQRLFGKAKALGVTSASSSPAASEGEGQ